MAKVISKENINRTNKTKNPSISAQRDITNKIARELGLKPMLVRKIISMALYAIGRKMNKEHSEVIIPNFGKFAFTKKNKYRQAGIEKSIKKNGKN